MKKKIRIKSKFKFITFVLLTTVFTIFTISMIFNNSLKNYDNHEEKHIQIQVMSGDSLWTIAKKYGNKNKDIRENIYYIASINNIENTNIYAGQKLMIPIYEK